MSGNYAGGKQAGLTNKKRYGDDYYARIGSKGGSVKGKKGGFAADPSLARYGGYIGGHMSRRGGTLTPEEKLEIRKKLVKSRKQYIAEADQLERERLDRIARKFGKGMKTV